jgi:hypothetical protein
MGGVRRKSATRAVDQAASRKCNSMYNERLVPLSAFEHGIRCTIEGIVRGVHEVATNLAIPSYLLTLSECRNPIAVILGAGLIANA